MNKLCDLHTHSVFSDGTFTPTQLIEKANEMGLSAVALCDHNTVDGLPEFLQAGANSKAEAVAGAEFSVDYNGTELHLLGLCIPERAFSQLSDLMVEVNARKEQSNLDLIASLNRDGYCIDAAAIAAKTPKGKFNRAHIAAELTEKGYTPSVKHAFDTLLSKDTGYYKEPKRLTVWDMIKIIRPVGAIPVLAHPFLNLTESELLAFLPLAKERGLVGMECFYSTYDSALTQTSIRIAEYLDLACSGGSDFHGERKPDIMLGTGRGDLAVPYNCLRQLKQHT